MPLKDKKAYRKYQNEYKRKRRKSSVWTKQNQPSKEVILRSELKTLYGITPEEYQRMLDEQKGVCAICYMPETRTFRGKITRLCVDHVHDDTKQVRGLLCYRCKVAIGYFKDEVLRLQEAIVYLTKQRGVYGG